MARFRFPENFFEKIKLNNILLILLGSIIVSFGLYNIHDVSNITEGGILGLDLLLDQWFRISPSITHFLLTAICFLIGWKILGYEFIIYSAFAAAFFSLFYSIWEQFPPLFPQIAENPLLASILGACFVGIGTGLSVRAGGAQSGDDALAMSLSTWFHVRISLIYLISDLWVLALSLTYIPLSRIVYSLLTVVLSGLIIELVTSIGRKKPA